MKLSLLAAIVALSIPVVAQAEKFVHPTAKVFICSEKIFFTEAEAPRLVSLGKMVQVIDYGSSFLVLDSKEGSVAFSGEYNDFREKGRKKGIYSGIIMTKYDDSKELDYSFASGKFIMEWNCKK